MTKRRQLRFARKQVKRTISDSVTILTPPPYVVGQRIRIEVHRGPLTGTPMMATVTEVTVVTVSFVYGGGKTETVQVRADGTPVEKSVIEKVKKIGS